MQGASNTRGIGVGDVEAVLDTAEGAQNSNDIGVADSEMTCEAQSHATEEPASLSRQSSFYAEAAGYGKIALFTMNIVLGLAFSQIAGVIMSHDVYHVWYEVCNLVSMTCLSFIMINVGYEFVIDKNNLRQYGTDYLVAMTAASFPWFFVAFWFIWVLPYPLPWQQALLAARFAAPTSAGVLFCLLEVAGLKETWVFKKARILAIFDDLDTILLMLPLKAVLIGLKWELFVSLFLVVGLCVFGYVRLHAYHLPAGWKWTMVYAVLIMAICWIIHYVTKEHIAMEAIHLEVLLPAFILGAVIHVDHDTPVPHTSTEAEHRDAAEQADRRERARLADERVHTVVSAFFMVFVGLSMPPLFGGDDEDAEDSMSAGAFVGHVVAVSALMVLGKMFPLFCYRKESDVRTRLALSIGMCPRGEVGAGVILISLALGVKGDAAAIAVVALALNMMMSGFFIMVVKQLVTRRDDVGKKVIKRRISHLWTSDNELLTCGNLTDSRENVPPTLLTSGYLTNSQKNVPPADAVGVQYSEGSLSRGCSARVSLTDAAYGKFCGCPIC